MEANYLLLFIAGVPLLGFLSSLLLPGSKEKVLSVFSFQTVLLTFLFILSFTVIWMIHGGKPMNVEELVVYQSNEYEFRIEFLFNYVSATFLLIGAFVTLLIVRYSRYYMHLEDGYKRFFNTILFFYFGYNFTVLSGNFETLFVGWEILGLSSFLLIAFYRDRYLPVRNAVKVFSVYRIGDVGILLAMWASHHLWHENISFIKLQNETLVHEHLEGHSLIGLFIAVSIVVAAAAKSAQLPFSSWLPRAMEGPTPSSAIFYGSLSVHFGVFLLIRTYPFWEQQISARILIGALGVATAVICYFIARVQSTIKTQIAYASIVQIGLMFVEISLGWTQVALIHFAGNAFLRSYQLLISPSIVNYAIRDQYYHFQEKEQHRFTGTLRRLEYSVYVWSIKEWGLDNFMNSVVFANLKKIGRRMNLMSLNLFSILVAVLFVMGLILFIDQDIFPELTHTFLPYLYMIMAFMMVLRSFSERGSPLLAWTLVFIAHVFVATAISFNEKFDGLHSGLFLSGFIVSFILGFIILNKMRKAEKKLFNLNYYSGHVYEYKISSFIFLISAMGLMGFPITSSFLGEDLIMSHIHSDQVILAFFYSMIYVMGGIALVRVYARVYLGPHAKSYHQTSIKTA